jgi:Trpc4-associated protein
MLFLLMNVVTIRDVNHENICCINTLLLILIYAARKSSLSVILRRVKGLVNERMAWAAGRVDQTAKVRAGEVYEFTEDEEGNEAVVDRELDNGEVLMVNFRELLWFWKEYYQRRGRDRLSLEFSSRIPFCHWHALVKDLCADDGTPHALIERPLKKITSPYERMARASLSSNVDYVGQRF